MCEQHLDLLPVATRLQIFGRASDAPDHIGFVHVAFVLEVARYCCKLLPPGQVNVLEALSKTKSEGQTCRHCARPFPTAVCAARWLSARPSRPPSRPCHKPCRRSAVSAGRRTGP